MKTLKVLTIVLLINSSLFSQSLFHVDANKKRLMLNIELINNEGNKYNGIFITSDNEKTIFYNINSSSFYSMNNKDIYKVKLNQKHSFGKSFGTNIIYSGIAATIATIPIFATGDAIMIGPEFFVGFFTTVGGIPISLLSSRLGRNINHVKIDYIVDENNAVDLLHPIFQKNNNNSKFLKGDTKIINIPSNKNDSILKTIAKPSSYYHPLHENKFHFSAGLSTLYSNLGSQVKRGLKEYDFNQDVHNSSYGFSNSISLNLKLSYLVKNNVRVYAMYNSTNEFASVHAKTNTEESIMITHEIYNFSAGAEYVFKPVNRLFAKRYEFSVNAGLAINDYSNVLRFRKKHIVEGYSIYDNGIEESMYYKIPSIEFGGNFNYYISRNLSFKASIIGTLMLPKKIQNFEYTSSTHEIVNSGDYSINLFSITPTLGIDISF